MAKKRKFRYRYRGRRFHKRRSHRPSLVDLIGFGAPQVISNTGTPNIGYDVVQPALGGDFMEAGKRLMANEVLLFTGYDMIGKGWLWEAPLLNYGMMIAMPKIVKKLAPHKSVKVPLLGTIKVT